MRQLVVALIAILAVACERRPSSESDSSTTPTPSTPTGATTADLVFCVNETNRYRTSNGRPEVTRSAALEAYAAEGGREDAGSATAHQHFNRTRGGGVAFAENELHRVPLTFFRTVQDAIAQGIAIFYGEGPSGGHYENLMGGYSQVGCGVYIANGEITFVQDFR